MTERKIKHAENKCVWETNKNTNNEWEEVQDEDELIRNKNGNSFEYLKISSQLHFIQILYLAYTQRHMAEREQERISCKKKGENKTQTELMHIHKK